MKMQFHGMLLLAAITFGAAHSKAEGLIAEIPFHFRTSNAELPAGTYSVWVTVLDGNPGGYSAPMELAISGRSPDGSYPVHPDQLPSQPIISHGQGAAHLICFDRAIACSIPLVIPGSSQSTGLGIKCSQIVPGIGRDIAERGSYRP